MNENKWSAHNPTNIAKELGLDLATATAWAAGHRQMMKDTQAALGEGLLIGKDGAELGDHVNAVIDEGGCYKRNGTVNNMRALSKRRAANLPGSKQWVYQCHTSEPPDNSTLAAFLAGAGEGHYLTIGGWHKGAQGHWSPDFARPLGPPLADATYNGTSWHREFASGTKVVFTPHVNPVSGKDMGGVGEVTWGTKPLKTKDAPGVKRYTGPKTPDQVGQVGRSTIKSDDLQPQCNSNTPASPSPAIGDTCSVLPAGNDCKTGSCDTASAFAVQGTTSHAEKREFLVTLGLTSDHGHRQLGPRHRPNYNDKVTLYAGIVGKNGTGDIWAFNPLLTQAPGSGSYNAQCIELDLNNMNAHRGDADAGAGLAEPVTYGWSVTGAGKFRSTAAIGVMGQKGMWNRGIVFAADSIAQSAFQDLGTSHQTSIDIRGSPVYGIYQASRKTKNWFNGNTTHDGELRLRGKAKLVVERPGPQRRGQRQRGRGGREQRRRGARRQRCRRCLAGRRALRERARALVPAHRGRAADAEPACGERA